MAEQLDPEKTICIICHNDEEVGRIPVTAPNAVDYIDELVRCHGSLQIKYEADPTGGLLATLHGR